jgi:hypothetical protein
MLRAGETPFLHVENSKQRVIDPYHELGFVSRVEFTLMHVKRIA